MGCMSHRRKEVEVRPEQKWDYICLGDFKSSSCFTLLAYAYLWISIFISIAVYGVDTFTAVNILAFDRFFPTFDEEIPLISRTAAKWIVTICIILTILNLVYEYIRAWKIMKRGSVAECFLDNLAARAESARVGSGQGWRRFLVFAELTKSKKGAEYVALFTFWSFQSWIRVLLCNGPRQFVNAIFLYTYATSEFTIGSTDDFQTGFLSIFDKIKAIAMEDARQALILSGMIFTLVVWVFTFLSLLLAFFFFVFFLWHWIPRTDGGLTGYCERKVNKRLMKIVSVKVNKALAKEEEARFKAEKKMARKNGEKAPEERQATLPSFANDDALPVMPTLQRTNTGGSLPPYASNSDSPGGSSFEMDKMDQKRPFAATRTNTTMTASSMNSYSSKVPLMGNGAEMGGYRSESPAPSLPALDLGSLASPVRTMTNSTTRTHGQSPLGRGTNSPSPFGAAYTSSPSTYSPEDSSPVMPPPVRTMTGASSVSNFSRGPTPSRQTPGHRPPYVGGQSSYPNDYQSNGRASPSPSMRSQASIASPAPRPFPQGREPMRSATGPVPPRGPQYPPARNMTGPIQPRPQPPQQRSDYLNSSSGGDYGYNYDVESQRGPRY